MKLMRLTLAAAAGGIAANYLLNKNRASGSAARAKDASSWPDGAQTASDSSTSSASGRAESPSAASSDSPNAAERIRASRPANSLAGSGGESLDPLRSNARDGEYARSTGLSDFARGA